METLVSAPSDTSREAPRLGVTQRFGGWNHKMADAAPTLDPFGKVREWLSLNSQQMSNGISWNLTGSHIYIPEPIPGVQEIQDTD